MPYNSGLQMSSGNLMNKRLLDILNYGYRNHVAGIYIKGLLEMQHQQLQMHIHVFPKPYAFLNSNFGIGRDREHLQLGVWFLMLAVGIR